MTTTIDKNGNPIVCVDDKKDANGKVIKYIILENNNKTPYDAEYLTTMIKTGKMSVANMSYDAHTNSLTYHI